MARLIDADALLDEFLKRYTERERNGNLVFAACEIKQDFADMISNFQYTSGFDEAVTRVENFPSSNVAPVRHGRWIDTYPDIEPNPMFMYGICSECGFEQGISKYLNYCPNCGAKMDEEVSE